MANFRRKHAGMRTCRMCKAYKVKGQTIRYHNHGVLRAEQAADAQLREATR